MSSLATAYDYQLLDQQYRPLSLAELSNSLQTADVIFIGEYHGNQASHLLQMRLFAARHQSNESGQRTTVLSMEMFSRDQQPIVDRYLRNEVGERYLIKEAPAWDNYRGSYRPLVDYAKRNKLPVIAANAAGDIVRCIGRTGEAYMEALGQEERGYVALQPFAEIPGYEDKFLGHMSGAKHMPSSHLRNSYLAQATRDNTMAESIAQALDQHPGSQVVHLNGSFHSEERLGTVAALQRLKPELNIRVITPVHVEEFPGEAADTEPVEDFTYLINSQPAEFVDPEYKKRSRRAMFAKAREKAKSCKPN
ncbi:ChaN family lipoprotein [Pseudomaricurvus alkylphenolicus]|uniref:ChaN family lipoprotein n=1 Tax=Pseudomaricurvus alkylphenolicus TaxID=1306991 RepID=UPI0014242691|nr:ChaN family lipoprotein [Pseudomaricurvus alkylphenolicus]NIB39878.1 ChaN family lipoprotein [Pseudomaricurvus alkylphenolicus]